MNEQNDEENPPAELAVDPQNLPMQWRVKRASDESIYGPVNTDTLKEWANSGLVAPADMIDLGDNDWRSATEIAFLEMIWLVNLEGEDFYGPTTLEGLRQFIRDGTINETTLTKHVSTGESKTLGDLFAALNIEEKSALYNLAPDGKEETVSVVAVTKDARIMQLEEDLRVLRREHQTMNRLYRKMLMLAESRKIAGLS